MTQAGYGYDLQTPGAPTTPALSFNPSIAASLKRVNVCGRHRLAAACSRCFGNLIINAILVARVSARVNHIDPADMLRYAPTRNEAPPPMGLATRCSQPSSHAMSRGRALPVPSARSHKRIVADIVSVVFQVDRSTESRRFPRNTISVHRVSSNFGLIMKVASLRACAATGWPALPPAASAQSLKRRRGRCATLLHTPAGRKRRCH